MPDAQDIFVLSGDPSQLIAAYAAADAARKATQAGVNQLAAAYVGGNEGALGSLQKLSAANADLVARINALKAAHKELTTAQAQGSADVYQREDNYKRLLGEVQVATQQAASATIAAKKEMAAASVPVAADAGNSRLSVISAEVVAEDQLRQARINSAKEAAVGAVIIQNADVVMKKGSAEKLEQYARLSRAEDELRAKLQETYRAMQEGVPRAGEAYGLLNTKLKETTAAKEKLGKEVGVTAGGMKNMNFAISQASFAMDDFLTVIQMPGMGLIPALRSASNNVGVILSQLGPPWLTILPAAGTALLSLAANMWNSADASKKATTDADEFMGKLKSVASSAKETTDEIDDLVRAQLDLGDVEFSKVTAPMNAKIIDLRNQLSDLNLDEARATMKDQTLSPETLMEAQSRLDEGAALQKELTPLEQQKQMLEQTRLAADERIARRRSSAGVDKQFRAVDEPLKAMAKSAVGIIGPVDESRVVNQLVGASGIKPANDDEKAALEKKARDLITGAREDAAATEKRNDPTLMTFEERQKRRRQMAEAENNKRAAELRRPLAEMGRQLQEKTDEQTSLVNQSRRESSPGGREQTPEEKSTIQAITEVIADLRTEMHEQRRQVERQIEATRKNTEAMFGTGGDDGPGGGFRVGLNPVGAE